MSSTSGRAYQFAVRQPSWVARVAVFAALFVFVAVVALLVIPALLVGLAVFVAMALVARVRAMFHRLHSPNGALDGRRNVRVIPRE